MAGIPAVTRADPERPRLDLSGAKLSRALESMIAGAEDHGGIERYVEALRAKSGLFQAALAPGRGIDAGALKVLLAHLATVRRRIGPWLAAERIGELRARIAALLDGCEDTSGTDARMAAFCAAFPEDREHRWVRDLAAEVLHNVDPARYPLMCRWVWDARTGTGALREMWHDADPRRPVTGVPDRYGTFVMLREELSRYLSANGFFRDVVHYVDLLTAQVYAGYLSEQGDGYLRTDFASPADPLQHARRLLGLDGTDARGRTRLKTADGTAVVLDEIRRLD